MFSENLFIQGVRNAAKAASLAVAIICAGTHANAAEGLNTDDLLNLSLRELAEVEVTSVSKKAEKETEAAAAIFVITQEDIRRSGATVIPEVLRMVPGITVTQAGARDWTVTSRGFNDQFSNKLLVLIDGRTVYSPLFSGVIWDVQDTMLQDIERIEVIRGPGATLWGANAVNGVINIITKDSKDTQGGLATASFGTQINGIAGGRYGMKTGDDSYIRMYAKEVAYDSQSTLQGAGAGDSWRRSQAGFRSDSKMTESGKMTVQGDMYYLDGDTSYAFPELGAAAFARQSEGVRANGFNLLGRWDERFAADSEASLQMYVDNAARKTAFFNDTTSTIDMDFQHAWSRWAGHEVVWGAGYRLILSENDPVSEQYALTPKRRTDNLFNAFVQDKMPLYEDELFLTLGSKFEHNDYTGVEIQPSARISWLPTDNQTVWASVSRAVHTPSRFTEDGHLTLAILPPGSAPFFAGIPTLVAAQGADAVDSEELTAYELGYRIQPTKSSSIDIAAFYNDYDKLFNGRFGDPVNLGTYLLWPLTTANSKTGHSYGLETSAKWNVTANWQLTGAYSYLGLTIDQKDETDFYSVIGKQPKHMFNLSSTYAFGNGFEMTNMLYLNDDLKGRANINGYQRFDTRLSYRVTDGLEVSLVGQNLFDDRHQEFTPFTYISATEIRRSFYLTLGATF